MSIVEIEMAPQSPLFCFFLLLLGNVVPQVASQLTALIPQERVQDIKLNLAASVADSRRSRPFHGLERLPCHPWEHCWSSLAWGRLLPQQVRLS